MANGNKPVQTFRIGFVKAAVWENGDRNNTFYNVTLSRTYKDGEDYKDSDSFGHADLLNAAEVLRKAEDWISRQD